MQVSEYFIALIPEKELYNKIKEIKLLILNSFGEQTYLQDPPHLTLFVGTTIHLGAISRDLAKFASQNTRIKFNIEDWLIFSKDKITNSSTLAFSLNHDCRKALMKVQSNIVDMVMPYRHKLLAKRYQRINFMGIEKFNIDHFGFPYTGSSWITHIGVCSMIEKHIKEIILSIEIDSFTQTSVFGKIALYKLVDEIPKEIISCDLK